ncbi:MAG: hypothetical protein BWK79_00665 [Beggiatoa sp. IS2]|nr:MAG: hypothetical protein BWK79_00665 [Beggiatoa sp. IS2]
MNSESQLEQLANAILKRAQTLADSQRQAAQQQRDKILAESANRLRLREERELANAQTYAEQVYRRRVQATEIKMQAELDQLRWTLIQDVMLALRENLRLLCQQQSRYVSLLKQYFDHAAGLLADSEEVVVEVNAQDYALLLPHWPTFMQDVPQKRCTLVASSRSFTGGLLVRDPDDRVRVDNTFEGLSARLESELYEAITAQLFAAASPIRSA